MQQQTGNRKNEVENNFTDTIANIRVTNKVARSVFLKDFALLSLLIPMGFQREMGKELAFGTLQILFQNSGTSDGTSSQDSWLFCPVATNRWNSSYSGIY